MEASSVKLWRCVRYGIAGIGCCMRAYTGALMQYAQEARTDTN